jgi:hypothetical protein
MNPFAEIEVTPLHTRDGMLSAGKSVRIRDEEQPAGWDEIGVVSQNYLLVHNARVKTVVDQIADKSPIKDWQQRKLFFDGKRFVYALTSDRITAEVTPGDVVRFGLIAYNSYDGSRTLSIGAYAEHLVCSNGMTSDMYFARFTFKHHQGNVNWDEQTEQAFQALIPQSRARLIKFAQMLTRLKNKPLAVPDLKTLRDEHLKDLSTGTWGKVIDQFIRKENNNAFGFLDACTNVFWHNEKQSYSDYRNNSYATDALLTYARNLN